ncbi:MAG: toll/interleukin-1 receptor domain-containing protein [Gammaproteobacteria bacterium]
MSTFTDTPSEKPADAEVVAELNTKIAAHPELMLLAQRLDSDTGVIEFYEGDNVYVRAKAIAIGSWGRRFSSWRWAWANESLPPPLREASARLKELGQITGRTQFTEENAFEVTRSEEIRFVADACRFLGAAGACNRGEESAVWWFALEAIEHLLPLEPLTEQASRAAEDLITAGGSVKLLAAFRARFPEAKIQLMGRDLRGKRQPWANDLHIQLLLDFGRLDTHEARDLSGADLSSSRFDDSILRGLILEGASFEGASLVDTDLSRADLRGVSFKDAFLNGTNFTRAQLAGADFTGAEVSRTLFTDVDLSEVKGLDTVRHMTPSEVSLSTLTASHFKLSPVFLRKAGVSRGLIEDLARGQRFARQYETCFLSYSSKDLPFAKQLYNSLQHIGVRVFWDRFDLLPGETLRDQILEAIHEHDRLIVVLSAESMKSSWVREEIELAWGHKRESLMPIRLCDIALVKSWTANHPNLPDLADLYSVLDFSAWQTEAEYSSALEMLLRALAGGADFGRVEPGHEHS